MTEFAMRRRNDFEVYKKRPNNAWARSKKYSTPNLSRAISYAILEAQKMQFFLIHGRVLSEVPVLEAKMSYHPTYVSKVIDKFSKKKAREFALCYTIQRKFLSFRPLFSVMSFLSNDHIFYAAFDQFL